MNEFGGISELGRRPESDRKPERRPSGDWSKELKFASILEQLASRPVETAKPNPDPIRECSGESDSSVFSSSPFTKTPSKPNDPDWSKSLKTPQPLGQVSSNPADDLLSE